MERSKFNFLVLGATGMAGHTIALYLKEQGHEVTAFSRETFPYCNNIKGDVMDEGILKLILIDGKFDFVINCIGILNTDCDRNPSLAVYINSYLPHMIVDLIKNNNTKLIHMSTDCVFSGLTGNYSEQSARDGNTFYDRTKALGEIEDNRNLTLRNSIIGPDMKKDGIGLFNWLMKQNGSIKGYSKAIWTGVTTLTLAKAIEMAAIENLTGLYNLVNNEKISKFDLLNLFNKHIRSEEISINDFNGVVIDKSLINTRNDFSFQVPSYEEMIIEMKEWIITHKELYPHYFK
ncbi:SDR family oxidoreductase [Chengkuizengella sediminis]|uniref:SDR family oxidoreductase n=1 Tax=Chengkuizengella sediminis TaxID=1885917 RepID=UPI001389C2CA|nr:sugar nucleotide-binding protein [Chengkuizengella sediminis]NDI34881.1 sugar nucleotide-binding protein [Chengkuizengella sediminis]